MSIISKIPADDRINAIKRNILQCTAKFKKISFNVFLEIVLCHFRRLDNVHSNNQDLLTHNPNVQNLTLFRN